MDLILGQGLAGSVLALRLMERGEQVMVVDNNHASSSSMVAAGLWNPIVFRRINKSWLADELIQSLDHFYSEAEIQLKSKFYHPMHVWRKHSSALEAELWSEKQVTEEYGPYLGEMSGATGHPDFGSLPFGSGMVEQAGYVDLPAFLTSSRDYFIKHDAFRQMSFSLPEDESELRNMKFEGNKVNRIIDCRGYKSAASVWWQYLPFGLTKGEVLTVRCSGLGLRHIFNAGFFMQPLGEDVYRIGATFNWTDRDEVATDEARKFLLDKCNAQIIKPVEVIGQKAGVRPTVQDRRPLIGRHPRAESLFLFNGLGTKGVMLAPYFTAHFAAHLFEQTALHGEVDIARFEKFLGKVNPEISYP